MKISKEEKQRRADLFNISISTYYNWEKTKPELIKIIESGLEYIKLKENNKVINNEKEDELNKNLKLLPELLKEFKVLKEKVEKLEENI